MNTAILVEPVGAGFRAASGGPLDLSAEAKTAAAAVAALRAKIADRLRGGAFVLEHSLPGSRMPFPTLPLAENPLFDEWVAAVDDYRRHAELAELASERGA